MAIKGILLDLDGTVYLGRNEVPGAARFINDAKQRGIACMFVTNRSNRTPAEVAGHICEYGIDCNEQDVLTSSQATALYLKEGSYYHIGEKGLTLALDEQGLVYDDVAPDHVIVSYDREFCYDKLKKACQLIHAGSNFIATNPDKALTFEGGIIPGTGAIVQAVATGCNQEPICIGKPERLIFDLAVERLGLDRGDVIAVGDNMLTDIPAGCNAGIRTVLLLTGVSTRKDAAVSPVEPTWIVENYEKLSQLLNTL